MNFFSNTWASWFDCHCWRWCNEILTAFYSRYIRFSVSYIVYVCVWITASVERAEGDSLLCKRHTEQHWKSRGKTGKTPVFKEFGNICNAHYVPIKCIYLNWESFGINTACFFLIQCNCKERLWDVWWQIEYFRGITIPEQLRVDPTANMLLKLTQASELNWFELNTEMREGWRKCKVQVERERKRYKVLVWRQREAQREAYLLT